MSTRPAISLVIVLYGKRAVTETGLASLQAALGDTLGDELELVLVDNASPDDTGELLDAWEGRATIVRNACNRNFAGGCNDGARAATGEILVFLNNDMEFVPGAIEAVAATAAEPGVGAAGARLLFPDGTIQHAGVIWGANEVGPAMPFHAFHHEAGDLAAACAVVDLDAVTGACLAIRRELFLELGGFDESYINGLEDIDLCLRVRSRGLRIVYRGDLCLVHHESVTRGINNEVAAHNDRLFQARWGRVTDADDEVARELYGGRLTVARRIAGVFPDWNDGGDIALEGHLESIAPEAAEARALLPALEAAGVFPRARSFVPARLVADLTDAEAHYLEVARSRWRSPTALRVEVPGGRLYDVRRRHGDILRLALAPADPRHLDGVTAVWAATPELVDELTELGVDPDRVGWFPPAIVRAPTGDGGGGILVLVGALGPDRWAEQLAELGSVTGVRLTLLPTVRTPELIRLATELCPGAELLGPVTSETRFAELAGRADGVIDLDPADGFGRRGLLAAATGTALASDSGAVAAVLGELLVTREARHLSELIAVLAASSADRAARRDRVIGRCSPEALAPTLAALVARARAVGAGISSRLAPVQIAP